jgi:hypothetical protein
MNALFGEGNFGDDGEAVDYFNSLKSEEQSSILEKLESLGFNTLPNVGDTIGSIRFIAESGSVAGFSDRTTGEAASIRALVSDIDETGVKGDLIFSVASKEGASEQKLLLDANNNHELTGSLDITSNLTIGAGIHVVGDALITGKITAQEFHTEFVSASIIYQSGSTKFGDTSDDVHRAQLYHGFNGEIWYVLRLSWR